MRYFGFMVKLIYDEIAREVNRRLAGHGLTHSQVSVLIFLHAREGARTTVSDVQQFLCVSQPTATGLVRRLEKKGFLRVLEDPHDRRARLVSLTDETNDIYERIQALMHDMDARLTRGFDAQERAQALDLLDRLYRNAQSASE